MILAWYYTASIGAETSLGSFGNRDGFQYIVTCSYNFPDATDSTEKDSLKGKSDDLSTLVILLLSLDSWVNDRTISSHIQYDAQLV